MTPPATCGSSPSVATGCLALLAFALLLVLAAPAGAQPVEEAPDDRSPQTITFELAPVGRVGQDPVVLGAGSSAGLPVAYAVEGPCVLADEILVYRAGGVCTVHASQDGDDDHLPAEPVVRSVTVSKATAVLLVSDVAQVADGTPREATVTTAPRGLTGVAVTYDGDPAPPREPGRYAVVATLDDRAFEAEPVTATLVVTPAPDAAVPEPDGSTPPRAPTPGAEPRPVDDRPTVLSAVTERAPASPPPVASAPTTDAATATVPDGGLRLLSAAPDPQPETAGDGAGSSDRPVDGEALPRVATVAGPASLERVLAPEDGPRRAAGSAPSPDAPRGARWPAALAALAGVAGVLTRALLRGRGGSGDGPSGATTTPPPAC